MLWTLILSHFTCQDLLKQIFARLRQGYWGNDAIDCSLAEEYPTGSHVAAVHPLLLAQCPPERGGTARISYHLLSNSELSNLGEQGYSSLKKEKSVLRVPQLPRGDQQPRCARVGTGALELAQVASHP